MNLDFTVRSDPMTWADKNGNFAYYNVNEHLNPTNICVYRCTFCAFSKGRHSTSLRGDPYDLPLEEIERHALIEVVDRMETA